MAAGVKGSDVAAPLATALVEVKAGVPAHSLLSNAAKVMVPVGLTAPVRVAVSVTALPSGLVVADAVVAIDGAALATVTLDEPMPIPLFGPTTEVPEAKPSWAV